MSAILIACAVISAISGGVKIIQSFKKEVMENPISAGYGKGFWELYSYANINRMTIKMEKGQTYIEKYLIPAIKRGTSASYKQFCNELVEFLEPLAEFEGYQFEEAQTACNSVAFDSKTGKIYFHVYTFTPITKNNEEGLRIETMRLEASGIKFAQDWQLVSRIESSFLKAKTSAEIRYLPASIDSSKIVEAIAVCFAPVTLGLVKVPQGFLESMQEVVKDAAKNKADLPGNLTEEQLKWATENYEKMLERQKERDQQTLDGIKEIGDAIATLK